MCDNRYCQDYTGSVCNICNGDILQSQVGIFAIYQDQRVWACAHCAEAYELVNLYPPEPPRELTQEEIDLNRRVRRNWKEAIAAKYEYEKKEREKALKII